MICATSFVAAGWAPEAGRFETFVIAVIVDLLSNIMHQYVHCGCDGGYYAGKCDADDACDAGGVDAIMA